ncbi:MAG: polysaccharide biosynthesis tyrosine autokinase [Bacteroidia bacterium]
MANQQEWDIRRFLILLTRNWWWPVGVLATTIIAAKLYLRYTTSIYKSDATIQIELDRASLIKPDRGDGGNLIPIENMADSYVELFTAYDLIQQAVRELKLDWEIYSVGKLGRSLVFPAPFQIEMRDTFQAEAHTVRGSFPLEVEINGEASRFTLRKNDSILCQGWVNKWTPCRDVQLRIVSARGDSSYPSGRFLVQRLPERVVVQDWQRKVSVMPKRGLTAWVITVNDISALRAQSFLQKLLEHAREYERGLRQVHYQKAIQYIDTLLQVVKYDLDRSQDSLFRKEQMADMPFLEPRRKRTTELFLHLEDYRLRRPEDEALKALRTDIQRLLDSLRRSPTVSLRPIFIAPSVPSALHTEIEAVNQLIGHREVLMQRYTPAAPPLFTLNQTLLQKLEYLEYRIAELLRLRIEQLKNEQREWEISRRRIYEDIFSERQFSLQEEDVALRRSIYKSLLEKKIEYSIQKEAISSAIRITQPPTLASIPISPNPIQVYVVALVLGIIIGVGSVILWHLLTQKVSYRTDLEGLSSVPIIGELPYARGQKGLFPFSTLQLEIFRSFRSALGFLWEENAPKVLVVTSTVSGEGKSFIARGIAYVYALSGHRVLLIDADLRRAAISHEVRGLDKGLSLLLSSPQHVTIEECILPLGREGLYLMPSGPLPPNPTELLDTSALLQLIQRLADKFDYFILDTAPIGLVPDTLSILRNIPSAVTLYVFRADYSRIPFLKHLEEMIKIHHLQKVYLLFNGTRLSKPRYGYGYGYGYYGNGYSRKYYSASEPTTSVWKRMREILPI